MELIDRHILSLLIFLPLGAAFLLAFLPSERALALKTTAFIAALGELLLALHPWRRLSNTGVIDQFVFDKTWIPAWNVHYALGVDGVAALLVLLTAVLMPLTLMGTWNSVKNGLKFYLMNLMFLAAGMMGVFCATDLFLFYLFWEVMLVPMYFLIGIWGGEDRRYATLKFFIYTMAGSLLMLVAILYLYFKASRSFNLLELYQFSLPFSAQLWVFAAFALAFAIKVPLIPFHTWLPDAHVQAPTAGSVILAGVLLKMGVYGYFRFAIPLFPEAVQYLKIPLMTIAVIGVVYGALVAMVQTDMKKLIAYSSVSHMGIVMLGVFSLNKTAMTGGLYQMLNHGVSTGALFLLVGMLYDRTHTRRIADYSGLAKKMPWFAVVFLVVSFSSMAAPLTNGFVGEFLALMGSYQVHTGLTVTATTGVILGAVYMLWLIERVFFGPAREMHGVETDLTGREVTALLPFVILIFWMGIYPKPFLEKLERPAETVLFQLESERELLTSAHRHINTSAQ